MRIYTLVQEDRLPPTPEEVFAFFSNPYNLDKITPPWLQFHTLDAPPQIYRGCIIHHRLKLHGVPITWVSQIAEWDPPRRFIDIQLIGPYRLWHHVHEFEESQGGTLVRDIVHYAIPLGWIGRLAYGLFVRRDLERVFAYRREALNHLFTANPTR